MITGRMRFLLCCGLALTGLGGSVSWADVGWYQTINEPKVRAGTHLLHPLINAAQLAADANTPSGTFVDVDDVTVLLPACQASSRTSDPATYTNWPDQCNPRGMIAALNAKYGLSQQWSSPWMDNRNDSTIKNIALQNMVTLLANQQTPIIVPFDGKGNRWVTVWAMDADFAVRTEVKIAYVRFKYGYQAVDGAARLINLDSYANGSVFGDHYIGIGEVKSEIMGIPGSGCTSCGDLCVPWLPPCSCTPCSDPFIDNFLFLYGAPLHTSAVPARINSFAKVLWNRPRGFLPAAQTLTPERATRQVWDALRSSQVPIDQALSSKLQTAVAGESYRVAGRLPHGAALDYIVVPMLDAAGQNALAFIELDVADGAVRSVIQPSQEFAYRPIAAQDAAQQARSILSAGEQLGTPGLRWDSRESHPAAAHTFAAFWEFPIERDTQTLNEVVRVARNGGFLIGRSTLDSPAIMAN